MKIDLNIESGFQLFQPPGYDSHSSVNRSGLWHALAKPGLAILAALSALGWLIAPALAADKYWTPAATGNWSDPANWSPVGPPQNGDNLVFSCDCNSQVMVNDISGLRVTNLTFFEYAIFQSHDYQIDGNPLTVLGAIEATEADNPPNHSFSVFINCPLIFPGNASISTGGRPGYLTETTIDIHLSGPITVQSGTVTLNALASSVDGGGNGHLYVASSISGSGNISVTSNKNGSHVSTVEFDGASGNDFSGTLFVESAGDAPVLFNKSSFGGPVLTNRLAVINGNSAILQFSQPDQIGNNATIEVDAGSQLHLQGKNVTVGRLVLNNYHADAAACLLDTGTTTIGLNIGITSRNDNEGVVPAIQGQLNLNGFLPFDISGSSGLGLDIQASIGGNGFRKIGTGTLKLTGNNTFFGDAEISAGTIEVDTATAFGQAGPTYGVELDGGNLVLQGVAIGAEPLFVNSAVSFLTAINQCSWAGPVTLNTDLNVVPLDVTASGLKLNFAGSISGSGGLNLQPALFGVGNVQLSGPIGNLFTGPTTVNCQLLELNKPSGVNAYSGPLIVGGVAGSALHEARWLNAYQNVGANLTLYANGIVNLNNHNEDFGPVTFNGGEVDTGTGQFAIYAPLTVNPVATSAVINGYLGLPPGADRVFIVGDGPADCDLIVNAVVFGNPGTYFVKHGAGTMCLTGINTFNTVTLLEQGILDINSDSGLGTWPGLVIFDGATLRISGPGNAGGGVELLGAGVGGTHGAIEVVSNTSFSISGGVLLDGASTFNIGASGGLGLNGVVVGTGPLTKAGAGALVMGGGANNTYSGDTVVSAGSLLLAKSANIISVPGNLVIGPGPAGPTTFARLLQTGGLGGTTVSVNANSLFDLFGYYQSLTTLNLRDGGNVQTGGGLLDFASGGAINVGSLNAFGSHVSASITGTIGLPANASLSFNINQFSPFYPFAPGPELDMSATIPRPVENLGFAPAGITKNGAGQMRLGGNNTYAGSTFINYGTLTVDGTQPQSPILVNSGTLAGSGTVGHIYMSGGVVAPGDAGPGILTCSNLNAGITASGVLRMELNGSTAGSGYDQLNVRGTVNLAGVSLERSLGFTAPTGTQFDIISNDGNDPVVGNFNGLPDSGKLYIGGVLYQINYRFNGRPGNDVALQGLDTPPPPTLVIEKVPPTAVRLIWPTNDPPFSLQTTTNLTAADWAVISPPYTILGTNNVATNTANDSARFYRLSSP